MEMGSPCQVQRTMKKHKEGSFKLVHDTTFFVLKNNFIRIPFETFQEEEYLEQVFRTPPIPVQVEQKSLYSGINAQSPSKSITTIQAIVSLPATPLSEVE